MNNNIVTVTLFEPGEEVSWIFDLWRTWLDRKMKGTSPRNLYGNGKFFIQSVRPAIGVPAQLHPQIVRIIYHCPEDGQLKMAELSGYWFHRKPTDRKVTIFERNDIVRIRLFKGPCEKRQDYSGERSLCELYSPSTLRIEGVRLITTSSPIFAHPQWVTFDRRDCVGSWLKRHSAGIPILSGFFLEKHLI
ncbi:MAG: hypothetical protein Q8L24_01625 [bacterium]|nr:hypothetical protein [bacterium]